MANTIKVKRSAVSGKVPLTTDLDLGELAINTHDGKLFLKKDDGTPAVVEVGAGGAGSSGVLQAINSASIGTVLTNSTSFVDVTNASITITPSSLLSGILLLWTSSAINSLVSGFNAQYYQQALRNGVQLRQSILAAESGAGGLQAKATMAFSILDFPNTTSAVTYKIRHRTNSPSSTGSINGGNLSAFEIKI